MRPSTSPRRARSPTPPTASDLCLHAHRRTIAGTGRTGTGELGVGPRGARGSGVGVRGHVGVERLARGFLRGRRVPGAAGDASRRDAGGARPRFEFARRSRRARRPFPPRRRRARRPAPARDCAPSARASPTRCGRAPWTGCPRRLGGRRPRFRASERRPRDGATEAARGADRRTGGRTRGGAPLMEWAARRIFLSQSSGLSATAARIADRCDVNSPRASVRRSHAKSMSEST